MGDSILLMWLDHLKVQYVVSSDIISVRKLA